MLKQTKIKKDPNFSMGTQIEGRYFRDQAKALKRYENWEKTLDENRPLSHRFHANYMVPAKDEKLSRKNIKQWSRPYGNVKTLGPRQIISRMERASINRWQIDNSYVWSKFEASAARIFSSYSLKDITRMLNLFRRVNRKPNMLLRQVVEKLPDKIPHCDDLQTQVELLSALASVDARYTTVLSPLCNHLAFSLIFAITAQFKASITMFV